MCIDIDVNMDSCIHATSFLLWVSILKCTITIVWVLVILGTLGSQRFSRILEETLDIISFIWAHCDTWDDSRGHRQIGVLLGNVFIQIPTLQNAPHEQLACTRVSKVASDHSSLSYNKPLHSDSSALVPSSVCSMSLGSFEMFVRGLEFTIDFLAGKF